MTANAVSEVEILISPKIIVDRAVYASTLLAFTVFPIGLWADSPGKIPPVWSPKNLAVLADGNVVTFEPGTESRGGHLAGAVLIQSGPDAIWEVVTNAGAMPRYLKNVRKSVSLRKSNRHQVIAHEVKMAFLPMTVKYTYQANYHGRRNIHFKMLEGDLREFEGYWQLYDGTDFGLKSGTIVFYQIYLDPGGLVPGKMVRQNIRKDLPNMLRKLKAYAEASGPVAMR